MLQVTPVFLPVPAWVHPSWQGKPEQEREAPSLSAGALFPVSLWLEHLGPPDGFGSFIPSKLQQAKTQHNETAHITQHRNCHPLPRPLLCQMQLHNVSCQARYVRHTLYPANLVLRHQHRKAVTWASQAKHLLRAQHRSGHGGIVNKTDSSSVLVELIFWLENIGSK